MKASSKKFLKISEPTSPNSSFGNKAQVNRTYISKDTNFNKAFLTVSKLPFKKNFKN
jgi:hypothetical protein